VIPLRAGDCEPRAVAMFVLSHRHAPAECRSAFAAWRGFVSPLRGQPALASCRDGGHAIWWTVDAPDGEAARQLLPSFVAARTEVTTVCRVDIP
jgi:hypothetical protein